MSFKSAESVGGGEPGPRATPPTPRTCCDHLLRGGDLTGVIPSRPPIVQAPAGCQGQIQSTEWLAVLNTTAAGPPHRLPTPQQPSNCDRVIDHCNDRPQENEAAQSPSDPDGRASPSKSHPVDNVSPGGGRIDPYERRIQQSTRLEGLTLLQKETRGTGRAREPRRQCDVPRAHQTSPSAGTRRVRAPLPRANRCGALLPPIRPGGLSRRGTWAKA